MRRRPPDDVVRIDLDDDPPVPPPEPEPGPAARRRPVVGRRSLTIAASAVVLAGAAGLGVATLAEHARSDRLREAPGGVLTLAEEPGRLWERPAEEGALLATRGALVVHDADEVVAVDVATGEERWSHDLPGAECGPFDWYAPAVAVVERVVCVHGPDRDTVTVLDAHGQVVAERAVPTGSVPGPSGTVVAGERTGAVVPPDPDASVSCIETSCAYRGVVDRGRDLEVRAQDAVTGDERWTVQVPFLPSRPEDCVRWTADAPVVVDNDLTEITGAPRFVRVWGCGVVAVLSDDGRRLDRQDDAARRADVVPLKDAYVVRGTLRDRLVMADGTRELAGRAMVPVATDGSDPGILLVDLGGRVRAEDREGREVWTVQAVVARLLVQADGVAVFDDGAGNLVAHDLGTGEELWRLIRPDDAAGLDITGWAPTVAQAFTDGDRMVVTMRGSPDETTALLYLVCVDLGSGALEWGGVLEGIDRLAAVDGRLVGRGEERLVGLG